MDVPRATRVVAPSWLNARTLLGLLLFCVSFAAGQILIQRERTTVPIWAASSDLPADTVLGPGDLEIVDVRLPGEVASTYAAGSKTLAGGVLTRPLLAGELVPLGWISDSPVGSDARALTVPVTPEHAAGAAFAPGDVVDIYVTLNAGDARARTTLVAESVQVLEIVTAGGLVAGEGGVTGITVRVPQAVAGELTLALRAGEIDVARVDGSLGGKAGSTTSLDDL